jgi:hypothetical protein
MAYAGKDDDVVMGRNAAPALQVDAEVLLARVRELTKRAGLPAPADAAPSVATGTTAAREDADTTALPVEFDRLVVRSLGLLTQHAQDIHALQAATDTWLREETERSAQEDQRMAARIARLESLLEERSHTIETLLERICSLEQRLRGPDKARSLPQVLRRCGQLLFGGIRGGGEQHTDRAVQPCAGFRRDVPPRSENPYHDQLSRSMYKKLAMAMHKLGLLKGRPG